MNSFLSLSRRGGHFENDLIETYLYMNVPVKGFLRVKQFVTIRCVGVLDSISLLVQSLLRALGKVIRMVFLLSISALKIEMSQIERILNKEGEKTIIHLKRVALFCFFMVGTIFAPLTLWKKIFESTRSNPEQKIEPKNLPKKNERLAFLQKEIEQKLEDKKRENKALETRISSLEEENEELINPTLEIFERDYQRWQAIPSENLKKKLLAMYDRIEALVKRRQNECLTSISLLHENEIVLDTLVSDAWNRSLLTFTKKLHELSLIKIALNS